MKAILISIQSPHACNILNLIKLWEIRKKFPKDYVGWVYIYVTKALPHLSKTYVGDYEVYDDTQWDKEWLDLNGKVVARFWCDKVEEIKLNLAMRFFTKSMNEEELLKQSCLTPKELENYLWSNICCGYAIHITKLEIFEEPKPLSDFMPRKWDKCGVKDKNGLYQCHKCPHAIHYGHGFGDCGYAPLKRPPQSWQYVEVTL